jgi:outer membrane murein-binding lipoprotein Lpp
MIRWKRRRLTSRCQVAHRHAAVLGAVLLLTGCAGTAVRENFATVQDETHSHLSADVQWLTTDDAGIASTNHASIRARYSAGNQVAM